ncbi:hypothetical protein H2203_008509 [Taxawa tesnikishii (nom. ined.)]|nr:hypothetical protein H2203_008509 [Dothideales sp. JES 119]
MIPSTFLDKPNFTRRKSKLERLHRVLWDRFEEYKAMTTVELHTQIEDPKQRTRDLVDMIEGLSSAA